MEMAHETFRENRSIGGIILNSGKNPASRGCAGDHIPGKGD